MKMRKVLAVVVAGVLAFSTCTFAENTKDIKVYFDGEKMEFDTDIYIESDRVMGPMRSLFEKAGMRVEWQLRLP